MLEMAKVKITFVMVNIPPSVRVTWSVPTHLHTLLCKTTGISTVPEMQ